MWQMMIHGFMLSLTLLSFLCGLKIYVGVFQPLSTPMMSTCSTNMLHRGSLVPRLPNPSNTCKKRSRGIWGAVCAKIKIHVAFIFPVGIFFFYDIFMQKVQRIQ